MSAATVTTVMAALGKAWPQTTRHSGRPLTRAVVMYSADSCSSMKLRVIRLI